jgi:lipid-binding SYLF domain-containing protein
MGQSALTRNKRIILLMTLAAAIPAIGADDTALRLERAATVFNGLTESGHSIPAEQLAAADCIVIPGFKKGAAVVGVGYGRGFMSCRKGGGWSAPAAMALESGSLGVQFGGEKIDIVILSLDKERRSKLLSDRFAIGSDASAAWGNGKSAHEDPNARFLFYGVTTGAFAGFGLDGATLKPDESANKALYGRSITNNEIIEGGAEAPGVASRFIEALPQQSDR